METLLIIAGALLMIVGFLGSFLPVLPGLPISYLGLVALQLTSKSPFSFTFFLVWALIIILVMVLDNVIPTYSTKRFGGSSFGVWGCIVGTIIGIFFSPVGLILGPLAGAFAGEIIGGQQTEQALRSAWGSFMGVLASTVLKVMACGMMGYYFIMGI